jgi:phospholipase C
VIELYHRDQLVATSVNGLPLQNTPSEGDDTWSVSLSLAPGSPLDETYRFGLTLQFPSDLPVLTRRIPLAFIQQGFDDNWNDRNYVHLDFEGNALMVTFDPELASYARLSGYQFPVPSVWGIDFPQVQLKESRLSIAASADGVGSAPTPVVVLSTTFTGIAGQPIHGTIEGSGFSVHDFTVTAEFFLTQVDTRLNYQARVTSDLAEQFYDTLDATRSVILNGIHVLGGNVDGWNDYLAKAQIFLDSHSLQVGELLTPWLLGAAFDIYDVSFSAVNSQPVPATSADGQPVPQGDIVIQYVAQPGPPGANQGTEAPPPPTALTIITTELAEGVVGQSYAQEVAVAAASGALAWEVSGTTPPGLTFDTGRLTGIPTTPGIYHFVVTVRDGANAEASQTYACVINTADFAIPTSSPLPDAVIGDAYAIKLAASGTDPGAWSASGLPAGLSISPAGVISGTPTGVGSRYTVAVEVVRSTGDPAFSVFSLRVLDMLLFPDAVYAPRGDGDTMWKPPLAHATLGVPPVEPGPATTVGDLGKVDHIVVVMMENRSFDHMLGYLSREGGRRDVDGLKWEAGDDRTQFNFYGGRYYYPKLLASTQAVSTESMSPDHSHEGVKAQMADGMAHFVSDYAKKKVGDDPETLQLVMGYYGAQHLPVYDRLAREFAVCDHWFCPHAGPSWPNRFVTVTGDLNRDSYGEPEVDTPDFALFTPSEALTLFDLLTTRGVSWLYFQQRASIMRAFTKYTFDMTNVLEMTERVEYDRFEATVKSGLPSVTFIDPRFGDLPAGAGSPPDNDDAPPADLAEGQKFIGRILAALFTPNMNPNWQKTMLIIVYDEHGGFYDHVQPPSDATPLTGQNSGKLGPRVPAFVVSPYTPPGLVLQDTFDHASIAATILRRFCSPKPPIMSPRVMAARDLREALPLADYRKNLPDFAGLGDIVITPVGANPQTARTEGRRFHAPRAPDAYGAFLGGIMLMSGATPR